MATDTAQQSCVYEQVEGDAAIRVCLTHDRDFGLYADEWCAQEKLPPRAIEVAHVADELERTGHSDGYHAAADDARALLGASPALQDAARAYADRMLTPYRFRKAVAAALAG
jgi:hypothetical protein